MRREAGTRERQAWRSGARCTLALSLALGILSGPAWSQEPDAPKAGEEDLVTLDFENEELSTVIATISRMTGKNFIYDDRVRGRVTITSPTPISPEQAYAVFESVLQVKGFTTVETPGGALKVIPLRDAKETNIETVHTSRRPPNRDRFVTRLIPLHFIDAESIVATLKPLVSKDAAMAAYQPTNTVILTESSSNIRRIISIIEAIDVETYREELAVLKLEYADAATLAGQVSEIFGAQTTTTATPPSRARPRRRASSSAPSTPPPSGASRGSVRILTDDRTNSLIVLAPRARLEDVRNLVYRLDVPVAGGGRIHVYYLQHADAEELSQTLTALAGGRGAAPAQGAQAGQAQAIRTAVSGLAGGISVTADPPTNSLIVQASLEGYEVIRDVIAQLDVPRAQVLVEALIMEVDVTDTSDLGFNGIWRLVDDKVDITISQLSDAATVGGFATGGPIGGLIAGRVAQTAGQSFLMNSVFNTIEFDEDGNPTNDGTLIQGIIRANAANADTNIISAPHILTSDNEEAEIEIGDNIPIISSRVTSGVTESLSTSVNVERQQIGVTLRVTPQITEGDTLRLQVFQEITAPNVALSVLTGDPADVGISLSSRRVENTVVVNDKDTIVIGGLVSNRYEYSLSKVPWLGDIPILGWLFKSQQKTLQRVNLLIFLTPHIIRKPEDLELQTIRKREEFAETVGAPLDVSDEEWDREEARLAEADARGEVYIPRLSGSPARSQLVGHRFRYPVERMRAIEQAQDEERERKRDAAEAALVAPQYIVQAAVLGDESDATEMLMNLVDGGYDGTLLSSRSGDTVLYEIRIGPYDTLEEAQDAGRIVERSHGLVPAVLVVPRDAEEMP